MTQARKAVLDGAFAIGGAGLNTLLVGLVDSGPALLPVAAQMLVVVLITALVSLATAIFVRTVPLAIAASVIITDMLFVLFFVCRVVFSQHLHEHVFEELYLLPQVFVVYTAPTVVLSSVGFGRLASRLFQEKSGPV